MGKITDTLINMGYTFTADAQNLGPVSRLLVRSPRGQEMALGRNEQALLFPGDTDGIPDNDWTGADGVTYTSGSIYRDYYGMDDEAYSQFLYGHSLRTREYLKARKADIGLTSYKFAAPELFFVLDTFTLDNGNGTLEAGRYSDGRFVAQAVEVKGGQVLRMHFAHLPDLQQAREGVLIVALEQGFLDGTLDDDAGDGGHWLDTPGDLQDKYDTLMTMGGQKPQGK